MQWHEKLHEEGNDEIIHRKFAGTVSARMLVADAGWRRGGAWWASRSRMNRPSAEQLAFSKEKEAPGDALVGVSFLYNWPVVGWCVGQVVEANATVRGARHVHVSLRRRSALSQNVLARDAPSVQSSPP